MIRGLLVALFVVCLTPSVSNAAIPDYHSWNDADWFYFCRTPSLWFMTFDNYGHWQMNQHQAGGAAYDPAAASAPYSGPLLDGAAPPVDLGNVVVTTPAPTPWVDPYVAIAPPSAPMSSYTPTMPPSASGQPYSVTTPLGGGGWNTSPPTLNLGPPGAGIASALVYDVPSPVATVIPPEQVTVPQADDNWGCEAVLCVFGGWHWEIAACVPALTKLVSHLRRHGMPSCP